MIKDFLLMLKYFFVPDSSSVLRLEREESLQSVSVQLCSYTDQGWMLVEY